MVWICTGRFWPRAELKVEGGAWRWRKDVETQWERLNRGYKDVGVRWERLSRGYKVLGIEYEWWYNG